MATVKIIQAWHSRLHSIISTLDHSSAATPGKILEADGNGLPIESANTDAELADAVAKRHTQNTDTNLGPVGAKNPPIDADKSVYRDSTAGDALVTSTWAQIKAFLKTYWDTLYEALGAVATHAGLTTGIHGAVADEDILVAAIGRSNFMMFPTNAGWTASNAGSGGAVQGVFQLNVSTGTTANSRGLLAAACYGFCLGYYYSAINYNKKLVLIFNTGRGYSDSEVIARFQLKPTYNEGSLAAKGVGLKLLNYALWGESYGTSLGEVNLNTVLTDLYGYQIKIVHTPGVSIKWYVDGVLKGTQTDTAKIPSGYSGTPSYSVASIINGATGGTNCNFIFMLGRIWQQE